MNLKDIFISPMGENHSKTGSIVCAALRKCSSVFCWTQLSTAGEAELLGHGLLWHSAHAYKLFLWIMFSNA